MHCGGAGGGSIGGGGEGGGGTGGGTVGGGQSGGDDGGAVGGGTDGGGGGRGESTLVATTENRKLRPKLSEPTYGSGVAGHSVPGASTPKLTPKHAKSTKRKVTERSRCSWLRSEGLVGLSLPVPKAVEEKLVCPSDAVPMASSVVLLTSKPASCCGSIQMISFSPWTLWSRS